MEGVTYLSPTVEHGGKDSTPSALESPNWLDFLILCISFLLPVVISTAFGFFGGRHNEKSSEAFLMGDREMSSLLVGISLVCG